MTREYLKGICILNIDSFLSNGGISTTCSKHVKKCSITRDSNIISIKSNSFLLKDFVKINLKPILENDLEDNF